LDLAGNLPVDCVISQWQRHGGHVVVNHGTVGPVVHVPLAPEQFLTNSEGQIVAAGVLFFAAKGWRETAFRTRHVRSANVKSWHGLWRAANGPVIGLVQDFARGRSRWNLTATGEKVAFLPAFDLAPWPAA
jgi:hypothetical protein